jgi:hypothetical protein
MPQEWSSNFFVHLTKKERFPYTQALALFWRGLAPIFGALFSATDSAFALIRRLLRSR